MSRFAGLYGTKVCFAYLCDIKLWQHSFCSACEQIAKQYLLLCELRILPEAFDIGNSRISYIRTKWLMNGISDINKNSTELPNVKERTKTMAAFISEFIVEAVELVILAGVALAAIFCGKKLRDRKNAK